MCVLSNAPDALVKDIMTPRERLVTAKEGTDFNEIRRLLHEHRIEKVLLVADDGQLTGMVTVKDIAKAEAFPTACKDEQGQLRVARQCRYQRRYRRQGCSAGRGGCGSGGC